MWWVGRIIGASGDTASVKANANQILDEADQAYADFLSAAQLPLRVRALAPIIERHG